MVSSVFFCSYFSVVFFVFFFFFFFQAEDGIRDRDVTGVQTCALPISSPGRQLEAERVVLEVALDPVDAQAMCERCVDVERLLRDLDLSLGREVPEEIGRASCRERV